MAINRFPWDWSGQVHLRPVGSFYVGLNPAWTPLGVKRTDTPGILIQGQIYRNSFIAQCHNFSHHSPLREGKWAKKSRAGKIWTSCKTHFFHVLKNISDFTLIIERIVEWFHWWIICWPKKGHSGFWFPLSSLLYNIQQTLHPITQKRGFYVN